MSKKYNLTSIIEQINADLDTLLKKRERLLQQREDIQTAILPRQDYIALLQEHIDAEAEQYREFFKDNAQRFQNRWKAEALPGRFPVFGFINKKTMRNDFAIPGSLFFVLREPLKRTIEQEIMSWDWPADKDCGPPRAERQAALDRIDEQLGKVEAELDDLKALGKVNGVRLKGLTTIEG